MLFVRAANEGRSAVERFPKEKVIEDIESLAQRLIGSATPSAPKVGTGFLGLFGGAKNVTGTGARVS